MLQDLLAEFMKVAERRTAEFKALQTTGSLSEDDKDFMLAIEQRLASHEKSQKAHSTQ